MSNNNVTIKELMNEYEKINSKLTELNSLQKQKENILARLKGRLNTGGLYKYGDKIIEIEHNGTWSSRTISIRIPVPIEDGDMYV